MDILSAHLHPVIFAAYTVLQGSPLPKELALRLAKLTGPDILDLISLAYKVRTKFSPETFACTIMNAKSGACTEDCKFCAQSAHHQTAIETYPLVGVDRMVSDAGIAYQNGVRTFGLVTSGLGYSERTPDFEQLLAGVKAIRQAYPDMQVCASVGLLTPELAACLAEAGVARYNLNLQVNPAKYRDLIASTHTAEDRLATIRALQLNGIQTCTGGILGLGETMADRVELAYALRELNVDVIPLNVLIPIAGTAAENLPPVSVAEVVKTFAIFRLVHPTKIIKFAAGRETVMKDFQGLLMLCGANGLLTGGYLTTRGRETADDDTLLAALASFNR